MLHARFTQAHSPARSLDWLSAPHDLAERTDAYLESASELFIRTARAALNRARISPRDVDVVVTVSSTGIASVRRSGNGI